MVSALLQVWAFLRGLSGRVEATNLSLVAAGVAFYAMFAVFPGLTATISVWGMVADPAVIESYLAVADDFIPPEAYEILNEQIMSLLAAPRARIGLTTIFPVAIALFSARAGVGALVRALNVIHGTRQRTTLWTLITGYVMTLALVAVMLAALATVVVVPVALKFLPLGAFTGWLLSALPWGAMLLLMLSALGILYRYGPNTEGHRDPFLTYGAVVATLVWALVSLGFTFYLTNFGAYNKIYGSIGAVIALLMWLYLSAFSVLLGAALNAELAARGRRAAGPGA
ncbi:MAG: YihY/virulence factor BrkB family protein [Rhodobacteraceae bacterium]|jgi:membrane protein|nr:YihY/virulence factor BrkB family protein [Paracoccaceae bacterium]